MDASTACSGGEAAERTDLTVGLATLKSGYFCRIGETQRAGTHIGGCRLAANPCPCGRHSLSGAGCECPPSVV
ncbi:hypothetical protein AB0O39_36230, partial [Streptomyces anulatus]